jgi:dienelactone hydrolase
MVAKLFLILCLLFSIESFAATESVEMIPITPSISLETTIFKPDGNGPFPLVVMNHGKDAIPARDHTRIRYVRMVDEFLKRGYAVVLPMREGFSKSGGEAGFDEECNQTVTGLMGAKDIKLSLDYFTKLSWVDKEHILVMGQSFGGLITMAFGEIYYPGVRGTVNFAGGLKYTSGCNDWDERLIDAARIYGSFNPVPTLWFYGKTDTYFGPALARRMYEAYRSHGAPIVFISDPKCKYSADSHGMIGWSDGVQCYWPDMELFLKSINMPSTDLHTHEDFPDPNK